MTTPPENPVTAPPARRGRASSRPPGAPEDQSRRRPPSRRRSEPSSSPSTRRASASGSRHRQQLPLPLGVDAVSDGLTVSFDIRYVDGEEGERVAAAQAAAISALLNWLAHRDATITTEQSGAGRATEEGRAA